MKIFSNFRRLFFLKVLLIFIFIFSFSLTLHAIGVRPLVVDLEMERGETGKFELELTPGETQETAALNLYYPRQQLTGSLSYEEGDPVEHPVLDWLELPDEVVVPPGEENTVDVEVSVPYDAEGSHTAIIMVEPVVDEAEEGITFRVRYAVRVNINIDVPGLRKRAEILDFELTADDEDRPLLQTHLKNPSSLSYDAAGEVTIRDQERRLIERVPVKSQRAAQGGRDETTIYPGSEVIFEGDITEPLSAGTYDLQLFLYYADGRQIIERKTVEVSDDFFDSEEMEYIEIEPELITEELRRGGAHTEAIDIRNRIGDPIFVQIGTQEIAPEYKRSLLENFEVELRGGQQFQIDGRRSQRPVLIVRAPREEIEDGGYYDTLQIGVFNPETEENLEVKELDMEFIVGEDYQYSGEVKDITAKKIEDEVIFSATAVNTGDVHIVPQSRVYLKKDGEIQHTLFLELADEGDRILPEMTGILSHYATDIESGEYTADITLQYEKKEIGSTELPLKIEPVDSDSEEEKEI